MATLYGKERQICDESQKAEFELNGQSMKIELVDCDEKYDHELRALRAVEVWRITIGNIVRDFQFTLSASDTLEGKTTYSWPLILGYFVEDARWGEYDIEEFVENFGTVGFWKAFVACRRIRKALDPVWFALSQIYITSEDVLGELIPPGMLAEMAKVLDQRSIDEINEERQPR